MPTGIEFDLDLAIPVDCLFEIVVYLIDADGVPICECDRSTRLIPRPERLAAADFDQLPAASSRTKTFHPQQIPVVARFPGSPALAFLSDRRTQVLPLLGPLQFEGSASGRPQAARRSIPEENEDTGVANLGDRSRILDFPANFGRFLHGHLFLHRRLLLHWRLLPRRRLSLHRGLLVTRDGNYYQGD